MIIDTFYCPYCGNRMELSLDTKYLLQPISQQEARGEFRFGSDPIPEFVRLRGGGPDGSLCPHAISLCADIEVMKPEPARRNTLRSFSLQYDHPWFRQHDDDQWVNIAVWTELEEDESAFRGQRLSHRLERISLNSEWPIPGSDWLLEVSGSLYVAVNPVSVLDELKLLCSDPDESEVADR